MIYTNAQFLTILNGLGYREELPSDRDYPISDDESPLTDDITVEVVIVFQAYFNLAVDGIAAPETMDIASMEMETLHMLYQHTNSHVASRELTISAMSQGCVEASLAS